MKRKTSKEIHKIERKQKKKNKDTVTREGKKRDLLLEEVGWVEDLRHAHGADVLPVGELLRVPQRHGFPPFLFPN